MNLANKIIVITGSSRGLGNKIGELCEKRGATVVYSDLHEDSRGDQSNQQNQKEIIKTDVTSEADVVALGRQAVDKYGRIDIWINNAGLWLPPTPIAEYKTEDIERLYKVNVMGTIFGMRTASTLMKDSGTIVNIISTTAFDGMNGSSGSIYVSSKYALRGLTNVVREEMKEKGIKVIGVYPGGFKSDLFNHAIPKNFDEFMSVDSVAEKIVNNLESENPEEQLLIKRPGQSASVEIK